MVVPAMQRCAFSLLAILLGACVGLPTTKLRGTAAPKAATEACGVSDKSEQKFIAAKDPTYHGRLDVVELPGKRPGQESRRDVPRVLRTDAKGACLWAASWVWQARPSNSAPEKDACALVELVSQAFASKPKNGAVDLDPASASESTNRGVTLPSYVDECALVACEHVLTLSKGDLECIVKPDVADRVRSFLALAKESGLEVKCPAKASDAGTRPIAHSPSTAGASRAKTN